MKPSGTMGAWAGFLLLVGGLVHAIPQLYAWLTDLTNGTPIIQIVVGIISVIVAIMVLASRKGPIHDVDGASIDV